MWKRLLALVLVSLLCAPVRAQLGVPTLRLPGALLNTPALRTLDGVQGPPSIEPQLIEQARTARIRELLRRYPRLIETDPDGAPIVRGELLVLDPTDQLLDRARAAGFSVRRDRVLLGAGAHIVVLGAPAGVSTASARETLRAMDPSADFNHLYLPGGEFPQGGIAESSAAPGGSEMATRAQSSPVRVGLIDDGVSARHSAFEKVRIIQHGCTSSSAPGVHGTAVASLLVGRTASFHGAAPGAELYAADVYCGSPTGGATDAIVEALGWLASERVPVINVSLVGPANALLERAVEALIAQGHIIVAAVGNDGPAAPPLYPAAYPHVVGVTAVDARGHVLLEAGRGPQVMFAAPGADIVAARIPRGFSPVRGTSFASPLVAGLLALKLTRTDPQAAQAAIGELEERATRVGKASPDPVYGFGLIGEELRPTLAIASR